MILRTIMCNKKQKLSKLIEDSLDLPYLKIQKIIRNKDVKVNGVRVSKDVLIEEGYEVLVYYNETGFKIAYEDKDLIVVFKPRRIETVNEKNDDLRTRLSNQITCDLYPVHRLDRNTEGLVIFAKNIKTKDSLDLAIKNRKIEKFYLAKVVGIPKNKSENLLAYLKKDSSKSIVYISDFKQEGYEKIKTKYKTIKSDEVFSILEVELVTGKTHQIRAHLSHVGLPILGDEKYGIVEINKKYSKKYQCLCAYKLILHFDEKDYLARLDGLVVKLDESEISFL